MSKVLRDIKFAVTHPSCLCPSYTAEGGPEVDGDEDLTVRRLFLSQTEISKVRGGLLYIGHILKWRMRCRQMMKDGASKRCNRSRADGWVLD